MAPIVEPTDMGTAVIWQTAADPRENVRAHIPRARLSPSLLRLP